MTYEEKKKIADKYISDITGGLGWDDLPDINSLHDVEAIEDIYEYCYDRLLEAGFDIQDLDDDNDENLENDA